MGDVGSGKTLVAFWAMLRAVECGHQAAMMAPTELLAEQHYRGFPASVRKIDQFVRPCLRAEPATSIESQSCAISLAVISRLSSAPMR